jgi:hypothetical protein
MAVILPALPHQDDERDQDGLAERAHTGNAKSTNATNIEKVSNQFM